jgi:hypothetical protein
MFLWYIVASIGAEASPRGSLGILKNFRRRCILSVGTNGVCDEVGIAKREQSKDEEKKSEKFLTKKEAESDDAERKGDCLSPKRP